MIINKILKVILLLLGGVFVVLEGFALEFEAAATSALILVLLTTLYCVWTKNKSKLFFLFLVTFTFAHSLRLYSYYIPEIPEFETDYYYYIVNVLYITSYLFLIMKIVLGMNFKDIFSELAIPIVILIILDIFCVTIVSDTTRNSLTVYEYILEFIYNGVIMTLLSFALINYMYRNDNKSMLFLVASICIVFSEIIQLSYYYILENNSELGFIYSFFLVVAFIFLYAQSQLEYTGAEPIYSDEQLEV